MNTDDPLHPTMNDLKLEIGQVLVCWSFLEAEIRRQMKAAGVLDKAPKGSIILLWRTYLTQAAIEHGSQVIRRYLDPVDKVAATRNLIAHGIHSLSANPWQAGSAHITCVALDGTLHRLTIAALRELSAEIDQVRLAVMRFQVSSD